MNFFKKLKIKPELTSKEAEKASHVADFVKLALHFDDETLITKDGDIIQTIRIDGFEQNDAEFRSINLREAVRKTINKHLKNKDYFIYLHTVRERANVMPDSIFPLGFAEELNEAWTYRNNWHKQLLNCLFITVVKRSPKLKFFDPVYFSNKRYNKSLLRYFQEGAKELQLKLQNVIKDLERFSVTKLGLYEMNNQYYSQPLSFFNYLISLCEKEVQMPNSDLSDYLTNLAISYKFNQIEINDNDSNNKRIAAVFSIKETHELHTMVYDKLLHIGAQIIITECYHFVDKDEAIASYKDYAEDEEIYVDPRMAKFSGMDKIKEFTTEDGLSHCKVFSTITIFSDEQTFFKDKIHMLSNIMREIGLVAVREDFYMASCYWARIPGNMRFLKTRRSQCLPVNRIANFTSIHPDTMGNYRGSKWGEVVTIFRDISGNPYYFNFHQNKNGNTILLGSEDDNSITVLSRFLLAQSVRLSPKIWYLDFSGTAKTYVESLGGVYYKIATEAQNPCTINAFDLKNHFDHKSYFKHWLQSLLPVDQDKADFYEELFTVIVDRLFEKNANANYSNLKKLINGAEDELLKNVFENNFSEEIYNNLFKADLLPEQILDTNNIVVFDLSDLAKKPALATAYVSLLFVLIMQKITDKTIVAVDKAGYLLESKMISDNLSNISHHFIKANAILMLAALYQEQGVKALENNMDNFASQIFLSDKYLENKFKNILHLDNDEYFVIKSFEPSRKLFLLRNDKEKTICNINLKGMEAILDILS